MGKLILVVDDSFSMRKTLSIALSGVGYEVIEAPDGKAALDILDGRKINLIISDVHMPNMDGISFVKAAKKIQSYRFTPVIMLTTESDQIMIQDGKEAGIRAWIVKPFQPPILLDAVSKLITA